MVNGLAQDAGLHMTQLIPLPLTIPYCSKSRLVLPFWYQIKSRGHKAVVVVVVLQMSFMDGINSKNT